MHESADPASRDGERLGTCPSQQKRVILLIDVTPSESQRLSWGMFAPDTGAPVILIGGELVDSQCRRYICHVTVTEIGTQLDQLLQLL